jgi:hypothetical protein
MLGFIQSKSVKVNPHLFPEYVGIPLIPTLNNQFKRGEVLSSKPQYCKTKQNKKQEQQTNKKQDFQTSII